jgi:hypothetical protein
MSAQICIGGRIKFWIFGLKMGPIDAESSIYLMDTWGIPFIFAYLRRLGLVFEFLSFFLPNI